MSELVGHTTQLSLSLERANSSLTKRVRRLNEREKELKKKEKILTKLAEDLAATEVLTIQQKMAVQRLLGLNSDSLSKKDWLNLAMGFVLGIIASLVASLIFFVLKKQIISRHRKA